MAQVFRQKNAYRRWINISKSEDISTYNKKSQGKLKKKENKPRSINHIRRNWKKFGRNRKKQGKEGRNKKKQGKREETGRNLLK